MKIGLKRLDNRGVAHHFLIALVAVVLIASFGAYRVFFSKASTGYTTRSSIAYLSQSDGEGCWLAGRKWDGGSNTCTKTCRASGSTFVAATTTHLGYCTGAIAPSIDQASCNNLARRYVNNTGCSRKIDQVADLGATQCIYSNHTYIASGSIDSCKLICPSGYTVSNNTCVAPAPAPAATPAPTATFAPAPGTTPATTTAPATNNTGSTAPASTVPASVVGAASPAADDDGDLPATEQPKCPDGSAPRADGTCVKEEKPIVAPPATANVTVDSGLTKSDCLLLGREWIPRSNKSGQLKGCSMQSCNKRADSILPNNGKPFCKSKRFDSNYAARLSKVNCVKLHREWVGRVELCAQFPNQERNNKEVVNADQCVNNYSTYFIRPGSQDECFKPSFFNRAQAVARKLGAPVSAVLKVGPMAYCNAKSGWHWNGTANECIKDRVGTSTQSGSNTSSSSTYTTGGNTVNGGGNAQCARYPDQAGCTAASGSANAAEGGISKKSCTEFEKLTSTNLNCPPYNDGLGTLYCTKDSAGMTNPPSKYHQKNGYYTYACN